MSEIEAQSIMDPITIKELKSIIKTLPLKKGLVQMVYLTKTIKKNAS